MMVIIDDDNGDDDEGDGYERFKSAVRADCRCRGCVVIVMQRMHDDGYHQ